MKNRIITEGKEALERTLLMMKYDMKKTLTENVEVISEQENVGGNPEDLQIAIKIRKATTDVLGTDEDAFEEALNLIKDKAQYDRVNALMPKYTKYNNLQDALNNEFETDNLEEVIKLKDLLSKKGVNLTYKTYVDMSSGDTKYKYKSIVLSAGGSPAATTPATTTKDIAEKKFPCIGYESKDGDTVGHYAPAKMDFVRLFYKDSIYVYWENKTVKEYQRNGNAVGAEIKKGTWKCKSDNSDYDVVWSNNTPTQTSTKVPPITDTNLLSKLDFSYKFPGDNKYVYAYSSPENAIKEDTAQAGKWYGKNIATGKVFDITTNYPSTAAKLNSNFFTSGKAEPAAQTTQTDEPKLPAQPPAPNPNSAAGSEPPTVQSESLKKSLKKNLIEAKEKQEDLMVENKIITNRFNFLFEGRSFETEEEKDYLVESIITEIGYLKIQGYTPQAINEGLFSMLGNIFGGSVKSIPAVFGEYIAGWLTKTLGIPQNSYMSSVVVALVGNLNIADYDKFFSDCRFTSNKIADSLIEGYVLQLQNEKNLNTGASGFIVSALRNSVVDYFTEDKTSLIQILEDKIGEFLCPKLSKLSSVISDKTDDLKTKIVA